MQSEVAVRGEMRGFDFGVGVWYSGGKGTLPLRLPMPETLAGALPSLPTRFVS